VNQADLFRLNQFRAHTKSNFEGENSPNLPQKSVLLTGAGSGSACHGQAEFVFGQGCTIDARGVGGRKKRRPGWSQSGSEALDRIRDAVSLRSAAP